MFIEIIININAEIKNKLWNNFILNRLNVELYYNLCKNESKKYRVIFHTIYRKD